MLEEVTDCNSGPNMRLFQPDTKYFANLMVRCVSLGRFRQFVWHLLTGIRLVYGNQLKLITCYHQRPRSGVIVDSEVLNLPAQERRTRFGIVSSF